MMSGSLDLQPHQEGSSSPKSLQVSSPGSLENLVLDASDVHDPDGSSKDRDISYLTGADLNYLTSCNLYGLEEEDTDDIENCGSNVWNENHTDLEITRDVQKSDDLPSCSSDSDRRSTRKRAHPSSDSSSSPVIKFTVTSDGLRLTHKIYDTQVFQCPHCSFKCLRWFDNLNHLVAEHSETEEAVRAIGVLNDKFSDLQCFLCWKKFGVGKELEYHVFTVHGERSVTCKVCERKFEHPALYQRHFRSHTNIRPFCCFVCKKSYAWYELFTHHLRTVHSKLHGTFQCDECGKFLADSCSLRLHRQSHSTKFRYECPKCDEKFRYNHHYKRHMRVHYNIRPYQCSVCHKQFFTVSEFKKHALTHLSARPFKCEQCNQDFKRKQSLQTHMLTHSAADFFKCEICLKPLKYKTTLLKHVELVHADHALKKQAYSSAAALPHIPAELRI